MEISKIFYKIEHETIGPKNKIINNITENSKLVKIDSLFVAIKGSKFNGNNYIKDAIKNGAVAILTEENIEEKLENNITYIKVKCLKEILYRIMSNFYSSPEKKLKIIGITGTNGKTTTTYLIKHILEKNGYKTGIIGTIKHMVGDKTLKSLNTTPDTIELFFLLNEMIKNKIDYVIMEVSSHGIKLGRIKNLNFKIAGFTNLTEEHMDFHGNMENYFETKKKLFEISEKIAINLDDHYGEIILSEFKDKQHLSYGIDKKADIVAKKLNLTNTSTNFDLIQSSNSKTRETCKVKTNLLGKFNTYNILLAISIVKLLGEELNSACKSLKNNISIPGRLEKIETNQNFSIYLDYAHTPDGILNILKTINEIKNKNDNNRVVTVFGCGGDRDKTKRSKMGLIAGKMSDISIITSDNPRSEDPMSIINDILVGVKESLGKYIIIENRKEAINYAIKNHKNNDIILILGKGHENYQILKNETIEFNEHKIIKDFLKNNK